VQRLVDEAAAFPNGAYDDQVDALTQAIGILSRPGFRLRSLV
jgi:phage terminase large subunit-like protein